VKEMTSFTLHIKVARLVKRLIGTSKLELAHRTGLDSWRMFLAQIYLQGDGIEIGALQRPLKTPKYARVKYVDRMTVADLRKHYPELASQTLVEADIIDDGERLATLKDASQDFVIANHFVEHCQDPILAIANMLRVLRTGRVLYLAIPDKRFSPDRDRPITPNEHLLKDHREGPAWSKRQHFEEWVRLWTYETAKTDDQVRQRINFLMSTDYSIHYHVWTSITFMGFLLLLKEQLSKEFDIEFQIEHFLRNDSEIITILRKES
jgi:SAM-dependent methyltransferase